ncbi:MAG TPA: SLBB domain-containing protein, partial [Rectinema sp.]|nr:SLBB domain-containing protein [Rectinema sp.]
RVASREEYLPVVYLEGAIIVEGSSASSGGGIKPYNIERVVLRKGQTIYQVMKPLEGKVYGTGDLAKSYIVRGQERISVDLEKLLHTYTVEEDVVLQANDRVVIPYGLNYAYVTGFVKKSATVEVTSESRLSGVLKELLIERSSLRGVVVRSADGKEASYDLFKAEREGDIREDPYIRPGDSIEVKSAGRVVRLEGEVRRPGTYELLENEGIKELISYYGDGLGVSAKADMVVLTRRATEERPESESIVFDVSSKELPSIKDGDSIRVASREEYLPVVYLEGAIVGDLLGISSKDLSVSQSNYAILRTPYRKGLTVFSLLRPLKDKILSSADMSNAFIIRKSEASPITINLEKLLYGNDLSGDCIIQAEDRIVIPFGSMYVFVTGEVTKSSWVGITGLTRLRDVVTPLLTRYSSIRDVKIKTTDGFEKSYDLFKADRYGDLSQDPFLRPGDEIRLSSLTNLATIQGEVKRPGTYQLLPGEGLKELVDLYADGFTEKANTSRLTLLHYLSDSSPVGEKLQFDYAKFPDIKLRLYDVVTVPSLQELLPVVWFEGAVGVSSTGSSPETSQRVAYNFVPGETVSQAALNNRKLFSAVSDLASGYIIHADGSTTAIDLAKFIYDYDLTNDLPLKANDTIIVPFRQFFVSVSGAVRYPGRYPYIPKRTWEYYIGLAGGFDTDKNSGQKITIYDVKSHKVAIANREIQPEDNIVAESNSFTYNMMKISSIISTILSLTVLIINVLRL